jgi:hypothetical protein
MWNTHTIRKQPNRPNVPYGKPYMLYNWPQAPGVRNYGLKPNPELLSELEEQTAAHGIFPYSTTIVVNLFAESLIDLNEYLPEVTKNWCAAELEKLGYGNTKVNASEYFPDGTRAHCRVYLQLREALQAHITSGKEPHLSECKKPTGAWEWNPESIEIDEIKSANIYGEGIDRRAKSDDFVEHLEGED